MLKNDDMSQLQRSLLLFLLQLRYQSWNLLNDASTIPDYNKQPAPLIRSRPWRFINLLTYLP